LIGTNCSFACAAASAAKPAAPIAATASAILVYRVLLLVVAKGPTPF